MPSVPAGDAFKATLGGYGPLIAGTTEGFRRPLDALQPAQEPDLAGVEGVVAGQVEDQLQGGQVVECGVMYAVHRFEIGRRLRLAREAVVAV